MTELAINQGCDPDTIHYKRSLSILHESIRRPTSDEKLALIFGKFISWGCDIECPDYLGNTPLLKACWKQRYQAFQILVRMGANAKAIDKWGNGALTLLLRPLEYKRGMQHPAGFRDALITALKHGCSPTMSNTWGSTPFDGIYDRPTWLIWKDVLQETGYVLVDDDFEVMPMLISTNDEGETRVPISGFSIEKWRHKLKPWREEYWCESEERWKCDWEWNMNQ